MFSLQSPSNSVTYYTSPTQKKQAKSAAYKYKYGSPKIRDVLREKCRLRVKEARSEHFEKSRESLISKIVRQELAELEGDIKLQELIYEEIIAEANNWFMEEYAKEEDYLIDTVAADPCFCPICQKEYLKAAKNILFCKCGNRFKFIGSPQQFQQKVQIMLMEHERNCSEQLDFFTEPIIEDNVNHLNVTCSSCDYFRTIK